MRELEATASKRPDREQRGIAKLRIKREILRPHGERAEVNLETASIPEIGLVGRVSATRLSNGWTRTLGGHNAEVGIIHRIASRSPGLRYANFPEHIEPGTYPQRRMTARTRQRR